MANDPSSSIHGDLLPHIHLLSTYRYPVMPRVDVQEVAKWLMGAPKIARDAAPFFWTYLESPADGTIFLTWQPLTRRGLEFASDGYIWPQNEMVFRHDAGNGLTIEIYYNKCGFRPGEPVATHSRRRFRLTPTAAPNAPQCDPSLWLVHYGPADKNDRIPTNMIPLTPQLQQSMGARQQLLSMGQIVRKEFMLSDRVNWPQIPFPGRGNSMYAPPVNVRGVPQAMAYPSQGHPGVGPIPKRRGVPQVPQGPVPQQQIMGAIPPPEFAFDDDEDTTKGDAFDNVTPRDVSMARYQQNYEFMEEVLSSPYRIGQIVVADLGLGLKGELASLTDGIFEAQGSNALEEMPKKPYVGHLDEGLADEFRKRVTENIESTKADIEKMKADHAKIMARMKSNAILKTAELELREVHDTGADALHLESDQQEEGEEGTSNWSAKQQKSMDDILVQVESALGKHATVVHHVHRIQDGGWQEPQPEPEAPEPPILEAPAEEPAAGAGADTLATGTGMSRQHSGAGSQHSGIMIGDSDIDMGGTAAGLLDQMHTGFSSTSTPVNNFPTPQPQLSAIHSNAATPANLGTSSPQPGHMEHSSVGHDTMRSMAGEDITMEDAGAASGMSETAPDQGTGSGDWVVVPKGDTPHDPSANPATAQTSSGAPPQALLATAAPPQITDPATTQPHYLAPAPSSRPGSAAATPGGSFAGDNNDFSSLGDLDTAGDALAGYDPPSIDATGGDLGDDGDGLDLNMEMEDSAFGEAFHGVTGVDDQPSAADTPAQGGAL